MLDHELKKRLANQDESLTKLNLSGEVFSADELGEIISLLEKNSVVTAVDWGENYYKYPEESRKSIDKIERFVYRNLSFAVNEYYPPSSLRINPIEYVQLMSMAYSKLGEPASDVVLFLGGTGVGKSTAINFMMGCRIST